MNKLLCGYVILSSTYSCLILTDSERYTSFSLPLPQTLGPLRSHFVQSKWVVPNVPPWCTVSWSPSELWLHSEPPFVPLTPLECSLDRHCSWWCHAARPCEHLWDKHEQQCVGSISRFPPTCSDFYPDKQKPHGVLNKHQHVQGKPRHQASTNTNKIDTQ